jgi:hypothetical protein
MIWCREQMKGHLLHKHTHLSNHTSINQMTKEEEEEEEEKSGAIIVKETPDGKYHDSHDSV